jgi:tripartite-type tricarboxylate transporter receptor subunit TctC
MPIGAPAEVVATLRSALLEARASADLREGLERLGFEPIEERPEAFGAIVRDESERFRQLVRRVGMRVN